MRNLTAVLIITLSMGSLFATVREHQKTSVRFTKYGTYDVDTQMVLSGLLKHDESDNNAQGTGMMGKLMASMFPKGKVGTITDLTARQSTSINHKDKEYSVRAIEPLEKSDKEAEDEKGDDESESMYKVLRNIIKVNDTNASTTLNGFACKQFSVLYLYEVENLTNHVIKTDSLAISLAMTDNPGFGTAQTEQAEFARAYAAALGIDMDLGTPGDILGTRWVMMMNSMSSDRSSDKPDYSELTKLHGNPVVIDGTMYRKTFDPNAQKQEDSGVNISGGMSGMLGSVAKKAMTKEKKVAFEEILHYRNEVLSLEVGGTVPPEEFQAPAGYKQVKAKK